MPPKEPDRTLFVCPYSIRLHSAMARSGYSALATGGGERKHINKKIKYEEGPIKDIQVVQDFLPAPADPVFKEEQIKVAIGLSKSSVDFFKGVARRHHTRHQKMIRRLLDLYVMQHQS